MPNTISGLRSEELHCMLLTSENDCFCQAGRHLRGAAYRSIDTCHHTSAAEQFVIVFDRMCFLWLHGSDWGRCQGHFYPTCPIRATWLQTGPELLDFESWSEYDLSDFELARQSRIRLLRNPSEVVKPWQCLQSRNFNSQDMCICNFDRRSTSS